jgi:truncated hemoglobin YjbI
MSRSDRSLFALTSEEEVRTCLRALYTRMKSDRMVGFFFDGRDVDAIVEGQVALVVAMLGGPARYTGTPLPEAHRSLPLLSGHFDRRHTLLREVLAAKGVDENVSAAWLEADAAWRKAILAAGVDARARSRSAQDADDEGGAASSG